MKNIHTILGLNIPDQGLDESSDYILASDQTISSFLFAKPLPINCSKRVIICLPENTLHVGWGYFTGLQMLLKCNFLFTFLQSKTLIFKLNRVNNVQLLFANVKIAIQTIQVKYKFASHNYWTYRNFCSLQQEKGKLLWSKVLKSLSPSFFLIAPLVGAIGTLASCLVLYWFTSCLKGNF